LLALARCTRTASIGPSLVSGFSIAEPDSHAAVIGLGFGLAAETRAGKTGFRTLLGADLDTVEALQRSRRFGAVARR
jgi:hypothetical protein